VKDYSLIRHLCWGVLLNHDPKLTRIAIVTEYAVYLDDSGHPSNQPYVIVAGFISTENKWLRFEPLWNAALSRWGLGPVFHMTEFERQFKGDRRKGAILDDLISIINDHTEVHFTCGVNMTGYKRVNDLYALEECIGAPYAIAARGVVRNIGLWTADHLKPGRDRLLTFIEDGTLHKGDMQDAFKRDSLPAPQCIPKDHPCLQPADMLSWEMLYFFKHDGHRRSLKKLAFTRLGIKGAFEEHNLRQNCQMLGIPLRSTLAPGMKIVWNNAPKRPRRRTIK
jgi:hypothetical protein